MIFEQDVIKIRAPHGISLLQACSFGTVISHEIAHHMAQEYYGDEKERVGNAVEDCYIKEK